jgi:tripartite-type tricarboxylate transporter receptor subunit TctC
VNEDFIKVAISEYYPWATVARTGFYLHANANGQKIQVETAAAVTADNVLAVHFTDALGVSIGGFSYDGAKYRVWKKR